MGYFTLPNGPNKLDFDNIRISLSNLGLGAQKRFLWILIMSLDISLLPTIEKYIKHRRDEHLCNRECTQ